MILFPKIAMPIEYILGKLKEEAPAANTKYSPQKISQTPPLNYLNNRVNNKNAIALIESPKNK